MTQPSYGHPASGPQWVPLSPEQIRRRTFRDSSLARRGYRREDVDDFLARVADEVQRWNLGYSQANGEIHRLRNYFRDRSIDPDASQSRDLSVEAISVLAQAQAHADQLIANAQAHAKAMQYDARGQAEAIIVRARQQADQAARAYRAQAGEAYNADREQVARLSALGSSILDALSGASHQMDSAKAQMSALSQAYAAEIAKFAPAPQPGAMPVGVSPVPRQAPPNAPHRPSRNAPDDVGVER